jgi:hypothetical protein
VNLDPYLSPALQSTLFSAALTTVLSLIGRLLLPRSRIVWGVSHGFVFNLQGAAGPAQIHTRTVFVQNVGRAPAQSIEVHFNYKPEHFQVWPTFNYETATNPENRFTVTINNLSKREYFSIELVSGHMLPDVLRVRSPAGDAKNVPMAPVQIFAQWIRRVALLLALLGVFAIIQNLFLLLR